MLPLAALVLATVVIAPPLISLNRLHRRIAESLSQAIGRPVRMSSIAMRLLPRPGFQIADFVVEENPGFGAEPVLRSAQVVASVRILPLWRGRIEIARISFDEPSINLVRDRDGHWNFDSLLSQAAQLPKAPTAERHPGRLTRFPYIDASNARINFKFGDEKLPFSFLNADLAVWLANAGEWRIDFAAQPARTDLSLDLANSGLIRLTGSLRQAGSLDRMPMQLHAEWANAPLGQLSRLLAGSDADWRGQLDAAADITGSAANADLKLTAGVQNIHRAEFEPRHSFNTSVTCQARFTRAGRLFDRLTCLAPTGNGHLLLTGSFHADRARPDPALSLEINHLPVSTALDAVRLFRAGFASAIDATGAVDGNFTYANSARPLATTPTSQIDGQATVNQLTLATPAMEKPLTLPPLRFRMNSAAARDPLAKNPPTRRDAHPQSSPVLASSQPVLLLEPFLVTAPHAEASPAATPVLLLSSPAPMTASGVFDRAGFSLHLQGESQPATLAALGRKLGLLRRIPVDFSSQGTATLNLTLHGPWVMPQAGYDQPAPPAAIDGSVRLRNVQFTAGFLAQPVRVASAQGVFGENQVQWTVPALTYGPVHADGTLSYSAFCLSATGCVPNFSLHMATLDMAVVQGALLGAEHHGAILQQLLDRLRHLNDNRPAWPALAGTLQIGVLTIQNLELREENADIAIDGNKIEVKSSSARAMDGILHLAGAMQIAGRTPSYQIQARLDNASAVAAAEMFEEKWGPGTINLRTNLKFSGFEQKELLASVTGSFHWEWIDGGFPLDTVPAQSDGFGESAGPPSVLGHFDAWIADGVIANSALQLDESTIVSGTENLPLLGTINFARELDISSPARPGPFKITGSLKHPESDVPKTAPVRSSQP